MTGFSIFSITILYKSQDVTFGLFTTISVMKVVGTLHSLSYDMLSPDMRWPVHTAHQWEWEFFVHTSLFIPPLETVVNRILDD